MKKLRLVLLFAACSVAANAQELALKIPKNATSVLTVKGAQLFNLISVKDFDNSVPGKAILETDGGSMANEGGRSVADFGVDINGTAYYYTLRNDSMRFNNILFPLNSAQKFAELVKNKTTGPVQKIGNSYYVSDTVRRSFYVWDEQSALVIDGSVRYDFFTDAILTNYGLEAYDYGVAVDSAATAVTVEAAEAAVDSAAEAAEAAEEAATETEAMEAADSVGAYDYNMPYNDWFERKRAIQDSLQKKWLADYAVSVSGQFHNTDNSIAGNPKFLNAQQKDAVASLFVANTSASLAIPYPVTGVFGLGTATGSLGAGYGNLTAQMYMNRNELKLTSQMELSDRYAAYAKQIMNHKINKKLLKYINTDEAIAYMSYAYDMEAYLKLYPKLLSRMYLGFWKEDEGEAELISDFFSLLLDEKAIANCFKGDALFVLTDIVEKQKKYKSYEYDEESGEYLDVEKTRIEPTPEFMIMFSSDDTRLFSKLIKYGIRKGKVKQSGNVYTISSLFGKEDDFNLNLLIKDGIVFIATNEKELAAVDRGTFVSKFDKSQRKLLNASNFSVYFNPRNMNINLSGTDVSGSFYNKFATILQNMGEVRMQTNGLRGNVFSGEMVAKVPEGEENALKYILSLMEIAEHKSEATIDVTAEAVAHNNDQ